MNEKKITASIWGAGGIAISHAQALKTLGIEVKAVYDLNKENAKKVASICDAEIATDSEEEFLDIKVDVIHLCTPANLHYKQMNTLIDLGINIFCEKPLTLDKEEAYELVKRSEENNILTGVGFNVRFHEGVQATKDIITHGDFGPINLVHGEYLQEFHLLPIHIDWRYNEATAGKMRAVTEIGSHWMDLAQFLTGSRIIEVSATFSKFWPERKLKDGIMYGPDNTGEPLEINSEDAAVITFKFENGFIGNCVLSEASPGRQNKISIEVTGENKAVWWDGEEINRINVGTRSKGVNTTTRPFGGGFSDSHVKMFNEFYTDVKKGYTDNEKNYPTIKDGAYNVFLTNAIYESATNNSEWIKLNL